MPTRWIEDSNVNGMHLIFYPLTPVLFPRNSRSRMFIHRAQLKNFPWWSKLSYL